MRNRLDRQTNAPRLAAAMRGRKKPDAVTIAAAIKKRAHKEVHLPPSSRRMDEARDFVDAELAAAVELVAGLTGEAKKKAHKHLQGKHSQKRHGWRYAGLDAARRSMRGESSAAERDEYRKRAGMATLDRTAKPKPPQR